MLCCAYLPSRSGTVSSRSGTVSDRGSPINHPRFTPSLSATAPFLSFRFLRRMVRLLHHPIAAVFSRCLTDFYSPAHGTIERIPEVGLRCW